MPPKKKQSASAAAADDPADNGSQYGSAESDNSQSDSEEQTTPGLEELNGLGGHTISSITPTHKLSLGSMLASPS
jgi:hypothetical protein